MGDNCGVKGCHLNRKRLNGNNYISFHNILLIEDEEWRKKLLHKEEYLQYLKDWKAYLQGLDVTTKERNKMFLSLPTYNGIETTSK